jgi:streptogramin lyase
MLALPNGQILYNDGSDEMEVYTAGGSPNPSWAPSIASLSNTTLGRGGTYSLSGRQLAGLDPGATYGDDVQDNTNFPLVRITNDATGVVTYARTHGWSSVSVAPGASSSAEFTLPGSTPRGRSTLVVVANGIASSPRTVTVS